MTRVEPLQENDQDQLRDKVAAETAVMETARPPVCSERAVRELPIQQLLGEAAAGIEIDVGLETRCHP